MRKRSHEEENTDLLCVEAGAQIVGALEIAGCSPSLDALGQG